MPSQFSQSLVLLMMLMCAAPVVAQQPAAGPPVIVTTGEGVVKKAPDRAWVTIAAESRARTAQEAQRMNTDAMTAVNECIKAAGVAATPSRRPANLQPEFDYANGTDARLRRAQPGAGASTRWRRSARDCRGGGYGRPERQWGRFDPRPRHRRA
jgi:uncharacterized protein YggE